jgi:hypothetical protein
LHARPRDAVSAGTGKEHGEGRKQREDCGKAGHREGGHLVLVPAIRFERMTYRLQAESEGAG